MHKTILAALALAVLAPGLARAQDIAGLEDCTKTSGLEKRTGCFQSDIEVLNRMIAKAAADAQLKLTAANAQIVVLQHRLDEIQTRVETLEKAANKPSDGKKPDAKP